MWGSSRKIKRTLSLFISPHVVTLLISFDSSLSSERFPPIDKFVDSELYYDFTARSFISIIRLGKRKKSAAQALTEQTVHSFLVPSGCGRSFHIFDFFIVGKLRVNRLPQSSYETLANLVRLKHKEIIIFCVFDLLICFFTVFFHCFLPWHKSVQNKKVRNRSYAPKTANSNCCYTN